MTSHRLVVMLALGSLAILLVGCVPSPITPASYPTPTMFTLFDGQTEHHYAQSDPAYPVLNQATQTLIGQVSILLRTLYTPERFQAEIAPLPHLRITYPQTVSLPGDGLTIRAQELVVVTVAGEPLLLTRTPESPDWAVYAIPAQAAQDFRRAVQEATGITLP